MEAIIKITDINGKQAVSARELHVFLESKQDFSTWIKARIEKYGFVENQDFEVFHNFMENSNGGRPSIEYALTIDCAKELSMVEGNDKGKQARRYFIECEKIAKNPIQNISRIDLAKMVIQAEEENERLRIQSQSQQQEIEKLKPRSEFVDIVFSADDLLTGAQVCKILKLPYGNITLYKKLREMGVFFKNKNEPMQSYVDAGYFRMKEVFINETIKLQTLFTQKGLGFIAKKFNVLSSLPSKIKIVN